MQTLEFNVTCVFPALKVVNLLHLDFISVVSVVCCYVCEF